MAKDKQPRLPGFDTEIGNVTPAEPAAEQPAAITQPPAEPPTSDQPANADTTECPKTTTAVELAHRPIPVPASLVSLAAAPDDRPPEPGDTVWVVDANSLIFQVFHGIGGMTTPRGEPINAVFGFLRDLLYIRQKMKATYLFCAFDLPGGTFRHEIFPEYKGTRKETPEELISQLPKIGQLLAALDIPILACEGYEADDILATIAKACDVRDVDCYLVTADKDCRQLITPRVRLFNIRNAAKGKPAEYGAEALLEDWGIRPNQVVDFQTLVGDAVDNIPGVPLIGPKGAQELLTKYGTLEGILDHAGEIPQPKRRANILANREQMLKSRKLAALANDVPCHWSWAAGHVAPINPDLAVELCRDWGFRRLADEVKALAPAGGVTPRANRGAARPNPLLEASREASESPDLPSGLQAARSDFAAAGSGTDSGYPPGGVSGAHPPPKAPWQAHYQNITTEADLVALANSLQAVVELSVDTETTGVCPVSSDLVGLSLAWQAGQAYYVPVRAPAGEPCLSLELVKQHLGPVLENPAVRKVGQNIKFDLLVFRKCGITLRGLDFDTMIASYLLDAGARNHNLDELAEKYLGHSNIPITDLIGSGRNQRRMDEVPLQKIGEYAAEDADVAWRLYPLLGPKLQEESLAELFHTLEMPLVEVLAELEWNGIRVDLECLKGLQGMFAQRLEALLHDIHELAGHPFNIGSPKQLQTVLFEEQRLPVVKRTATGPSTDSDVLEELALQHPLPAKIMEHRQFSKLQNTYIEAFPSLVNPKTGRIHASFHQTVAATGRLSSSDPNLQNIPIRTEEGRAIRRAFLADPPGWQLLAADYSQIELRILAHYSEDSSLCRAFEQNEDIHQLVAAEIQGVPLDAVTSDMRRQAKAVNFGVIYGQSPFGLAKQLGISKGAAAEFIDRYFQKYPGVDEFLTNVLAGCRVQGCVSTILGRKRKLLNIRSRPGRQRNQAERMAINTVIQGSAADLIKLAMVKIHARLQQEHLSTRMLLQIHDELVFESPPEEIPRLTSLVREEMTGAIAFRVPIVVDVKVGPNWGEMQSR